MVCAALPDADVVGFRLGARFTAVTASHARLVAMTDGGLGVAFFAPFDDIRYFLPWRPLVVSPIGVGRFFSDWGLRVIGSELLFVRLPATLLAMASRRAVARLRRLS